MSSEDELQELLDSAFADIAAYRWTVGTGSRPSEDAWDLSSLGTGRIVPDTPLPADAWARAEPRRSGFVPRTNITDYIGPALVAHPDRAEIADMLNAERFGVEITQDFEAAADRDPMLMYLATADEYIIEIAHLSAQRLRWRELED